MHRFFVAPERIDGGHATLTGQVAWQLARFLRARAGERILVMDEPGREYQVRLDAVTPRQVQGTIIEESTSDGEPVVVITLYQAVLKADRFEYVLQKGT